MFSQKSLDANSTSIHAPVTYVISKSYRRREKEDRQDGCKKEGLFETSPLIRGKEPACEIFKEERRTHARRVSRCRNVFQRSGQQRSTSERRPKFSGARDAVMARGWKVVLSDVPPKRRREKPTRVFGAGGRLLKSSVRTARRDVATFPSVSCVLTRTGGTNQPSRPPTSLRAVVMYYCSPRH